MSKLNLKKENYSKQLAESAIYDDTNKEKLKILLLDQAFVDKELETLESEWMEQQEFLEGTI